MEEEGTGMRPIDADAITYCSYDLDKYHYFRAVDEEEIAEMPTLTLDDLRPKGRWVKDGDFLVCPNCESEADVKNSIGTKNHNNFCHCCGADMRGGGEDG